jgi:hypothetical protein
MNVKEQLKDIYDKLKSLDGRITTAAQSAGNHNLLSGTHPDSDPASPPAVGDLIRGVSGPEWQKYGIGSVNQVLTVAGGLPTWQDPAGGGGAIFEDSFSDASIHWAWTKYGTGATRTITEAGGIVTLHNDSGVSCDFWTSGNDGPQLHVDEPNWPHTIIAKVDHDGAVADEVEFGIFCCCRTAIGASNGAWIIGRRRWDTQSQNGIFISRWGTAVGNVDPMTTLPVWLKIKVGGGHRLRSTAYFEYSTDGISYTPITSDSNSGIYPSTYGFTCGFYIRNWASPYPSIDAEYDDFSMEMSGGPG